MIFFYDILTNNVFRKKYNIFCLSGQIEKYLQFFKNTVLLILKRGDNLTITDLFFEFFGSYAIFFFQKWWIH